MKNIFKETDVLLKEYGAVQLSCDDLVLFEHNKKTCVTAFLFLISLLGLNRLYYGGWISKIYGLFLIILEAIIIFAFFKVYSVGVLDYVLDIFVILFGILLVFYITEFMLLAPAIKYYNLNLKKDILNRSNKIKDKGSYRFEDTLALLVFILMIQIFILLWVY